MLVVAIFCMHNSLSAGQSNVSEAPVGFLKDNLDVACMALLPQCFTKEDWAEMCREDSHLEENHFDSCKQATTEEENKI